jgi:colanic acid biosynthesis glycosyl transferase WcaI
MKIIVWGINYAPEVTGIAPYNTMLCEFLQRRGHDVRMLTTFAYYPEWKKLAEDAGRVFRTDEINHVTVLRCWHYVPRKVSTLKRIGHEATFVMASFLKLLTLPKPDVIVVISPPLLLGAAAWAACAIKGAPYIFHAQDLQPDAAVNLGMVKNPLFTRILYKLEAFAYEHAAKVSGISCGMLATFASKGVPESKLVYFPNGVNLPSPDQLPERGKFRARQGFGANDFLAIYSGNLGVKQGLEILIEAAASLKDERVKIVISGDGAQREALQQLRNFHQLRNVVMLPLQDEKNYLEMLADADVCLITQQKGSGNAFFPSKLLVTLGLAKPVITVADEESELASALRTGAFGVNILPGQHEKLAAALEAMSQNPGELSTMGPAGRRFVEQFESGRVLAGFERVLEATVSGADGVGPDATGVPGAAQ